MTLTRSNSSLYGMGVFTTIAIYDGKPFLWDKHWRRLSDNALRVGVDLSNFSEDQTRKSLSDTLSGNEVVNGRARMTFYDETESKLWSEKTERKTSLSIITRDFPLALNNFRLAISSDRVNTLSRLTGIKSCNYLDKILALDEAKARGLNEAIQINERGEITSATMANIFWFKDNTLYTPNLQTGCLAGTTREFVLENLDCREVEDSIDSLHAADAIFLTSAGLGVVQVAEFETRKLSRIDHPILGLLPNSV